MRNHTVPGPHHQAGSSNYAPSVPISVYRELAAELQTAQVMMNSLKAQNQQLQNHNQQLRLEIERVVQTSLHLRQVADAFQPVALQDLEIPRAEPEVWFEPSVPQAQPPRPAPAPRPAAPTAKHAPVAPPTIAEPPRQPKLVTEQEEPRNRRPAPPEHSRDLGGIGLTIAILLIIVTAFGAGFAIVRPFLPSK